MTTHNKKVAIDLGRLYVSKGLSPFVPHLAMGYFKDEAWEAGNALYQCLKWVEVCDELHYIGDPTEGMMDEIRYANGLGVPVIEQPSPKKVS
jgi:hypothetical protein